MALQTLIKTTRPAFLVLTPACMFLGLSSSLNATPAVNLPLFYLMLAGALLAHISVNMLNEYFDYTSGLDLKTQKTPFSGGSGALPADPSSAKTVLALGLIALLLTVAIGIYFIFLKGTQILPIGLIGIALVVTYTQWLNRLPLLCLIAPGLGFGILMVIGTHLLLTGQHSHQVWLLALVPFFLVNNLLLLNQYPDMDADKSVGRKTFPLTFGMDISNWVYAGFVIMAYGLLVYACIQDIIPALCIIALLPMALAIVALTGAIKHRTAIGSFPVYLASNVAATLATPVLLGLGLIYG